MTLTTTEIEELRIAIAEEMGWKGPRHPENIAGMDGWWSQNKGFWWINPQGRRVMTSSVPHYTSSIDAIREAAMERFRSSQEAYWFDRDLLRQFSGSQFFGKWQLTALDWCIAFARTAKIWRFKV